MEVATPVAIQVFIMLMLIIIGFVLFKCEKIESAGTKSMSGILLTVVTPCVLIQAYQTECDSKLLYDLLISFCLSIIIHLVFILISTLFFRKQTDKSVRKTSVFTSIYSNCGFMGIPLLSAVFGQKGVFIGSTYLAMFNIIVWTHGLFYYGDDIKLISPKQLLKNPGIIGTGIALILFFFKIHLTGVAESTVGYIASLNTPLAMILLGAYLAQSDVKSALKNTQIYAVCALRLIILPLAAVLLFRMLRVDAFMGTALILSASCPSASIAALYAEKFNLDTCLPSQIVSVTTVLSILTLPVMAFISNLLL